MPRWLRRGSLTKPEYLWRPSQLARRLGRALGEPPAVAEIRLPWGVTIACRPAEHLGYALWRHGVYDLAVTETLWRLVDPGETAVDGGANIGYMTSVMALRVGERGRVLAYEPEPGVYDELLDNFRRWRGRPGWGRVETFRQGLAERPGAGTLYRDTRFGSDRGTASLRKPSDEAAGEPTELVALDDVVGGEGTVGVLKLDVETWEYQALLGARRLMRRKAVRDIVFEAHAVQRERVLRLLEASGYTVFRLWKGWLRPALRDAEDKRQAGSTAPGYLATLDPSRARTRLAARGWQCLVGSPRQ